MRNDFENNDDWDEVVVNELATEVNAANSGASRVFHDIANAVQAIAAAKGATADLRVSVLTGTVTTVTNQTNQGGHPLTVAIPAAQNQIATQAFVNNIVR
jgi:hypothetical protein